MLQILGFSSITHCIKKIRIRRFFDRYFPTFGLKTEIYKINHSIQSKWGKIRTRKTPNTDKFYSVAIITTITSSYLFAGRKGRYCPFLYNVVQWTVTFLARNPIKPYLWLFFDLLFHADTGRKFKVHKTFTSCVYGVWPLLAYDGDCYCIIAFP